MKKRSGKDEEKETVENRILHRLEAIENRIEAVESSLRNLSEEQRKRKQMGWLVYGVVLGGLLSLCVNLWTSYFMKVVEPSLNPSGWLITLTLTTIGFGICIAYLTHWAYKRITE